MAHVFISYARADVQVARDLAEALGRRGWEVWWDRDLVGGEEFDHTIERELRSASATIAIFSPGSVSSRWVRSEASLAAELHKLVPVLVDGAAMPLPFRTIHGIELPHPDRHAYMQAVNQIEKAVVALHMGRQGTSERPTRSDWAPVAGKIPRRFPGKWIGAAAGVGAVIWIVTSLILAGDPPADTLPSSPVSSPTATVQSTSTPTPATLGYGSKGRNVQTLQRMLDKAGFSPGQVDGYFYDRTREALRAFERSAAEKPGVRADGKILVGGAEWILLAETRPRPEPPTVSPPTDDPDVVLPDVAGKTIDAAETELRDLGLKVNKEEEQSDMAEGTVLRQTPGSGERVEPGSAVTLTVAIPLQPQSTESVTLSSSAPG